MKNNNKQHMFKKKTKRKKQNKQLEMEKQPTDTDPVQAAPWISPHLTVLHLAEGFAISDDPP